MRLARLIAGATDQAMTDRLRLLAAWDAANAEWQIKHATPAPDCPATVAWLLASPGCTTPGMVAFGGSR